MGLSQGKDRTSLKVCGAGRPLWTPVSDGWELRASGSRGREDYSPVPGLWGELRTGEASSVTLCVPDLSQMVLETGEGELLGQEGQG